MGSCEAAGSRKTRCELTRPSSAARRPVLVGGGLRPHHPVLGPGHRLHPRRLSHRLCSLDHQEGGKSTRQPYKGGTTGDQWITKGRQSVPWRDGQQEAVTNNL